MKPLNEMSYKEKTAEAKALGINFVGKSGDALISLIEAKRVNEVDKKPTAKKQRPAVKSAKKATASKAPVAKAKTESKDTKTLILVREEGTQGRRFNYVLKENGKNVKTWDKLLPAFEMGVTMKRKYKKQGFPTTFIYQNPERPNGKLGLPKVKATVAA